MSLRRAFFERAWQVLYRLEHEQELYAKQVPWQPYNPAMNVRRDLITGTAVFMGLSLLRYLLERFFLQPLAFRHLGGKKSALRRSKKIAENSFYALFYVCSLLSGLLVYRGEDWRIKFFAPSIMEPFWEYLPPVRNVFRLYYLFELGYYCSCILFLFRHDTRRRDFPEMITHHLATVALIVLSYAWGWMRLGLIILIIHDVADVLLYSAKVVHYFGLAPLDMMLFGVFAFAFYASRLFLFPRVILAVTVEPWILVSRTPARMPQWIAHWNFFITQLVGFAVFLNVLLCLHCFWFVLILRMAVREIIHPRSYAEGGADIRSDDEDDS